jgi:hypothetical protein
MRDTAKSVMSLPWAISMFGLQQIANMMMPPANGTNGKSTAAAFDAVSQAAEQHLEGWYKTTYNMGSGIQKSVIDLMMLKTPEIDPSVFMRMAEKMQGTPVMSAMTNYVLPPMAWLSTFMVAKNDTAAVQQEFANKLHIIQLVTAVESQLGLDPTVHVPLPALIERAERFATFPRLWAFEGIGNYYAERSWDRFAPEDPRDLLTDTSTTALPAASLTMLHAGIGMSFANRLLRKLETSSPPEVVRSTIKRFATLCRESSRPGYTGAALESLGLATRTLYPNLVPLIDRELASVEPELIGYFWHGAGRAMYFEPTTLLPAFNAPWRAVAKIADTAPHEQAYLNLLSGLSWAITVVNMRHPEVMATFLRHHGPTLAKTPAFSNGVASSLLMRFDTTPDSKNIHKFVQHQPADDPAVQSAWEALVAKPYNLAISDTYPRLRQTSKLEDLFHYMPPTA